MWKGDYLAALPYLEAALELNPNDFFSTWIISLTHIGLDQFDEAEVAIRQLEALTGSSGHSIGTWAAYYIAQGDETSARGMLDQLLALHDAGNEDPIIAPVICTTYGLLGDIEKAIDWFERGAETLNHQFRALPIISLYNQPAFWNHPRFQAILEKMNLDDASVAEAREAMAGL
jgi:tetratricopeptide (TPR) repeat protein